MINAILDRVFKFLPWQLVVVCFVFAVIAFAGIYQYIGPFDNDNMVVGGVVLCFVVFASIAGGLLEWRKRSTVNPKSRRRKK
jgi:peptidoglycan/LPS O-acetylase OafA/YrhL